MRLLDDGLAPSPRCSPTRCRERDWKQVAVLRAEAFIEAHLDEAVPIWRLAEAIGVKERSLRKAFREVRGVSPNRFAIQVRLAVVRRALRQPMSAHATVTAIATDYGFYELGRFAATYKAAFGETPSTTLRSAGGGVRMHA